ncbi:MAG TPA: hypothetical protein VEA19_07515, partial [Actinomycetota bacterium]|nr:hypothetical protein [Actinomycetota bacterium]
MAAAYADPTWAAEAEICKQIGNWRKTLGTLGKISSSDVQGGAAYLVASRTISGVTDQRIMTVKRDADGGWRYAGNSACYGEESPQDLGNRHLDEG